MASRVRADTSKSQLFSTRVVLAKDNPPCTSNWRFDRFYRFSRFVGSITYVMSILLDGSNPTRSTSCCCAHGAGQRIGTDQS